MFSYWNFWNLIWIFINKVENKHFYAVMQKLEKEMDIIL